MTRIDLTRRGLALAALAFAVGATSGSAQQRDERWLPWIGCWQPVAEEAGDALLCVRPAEMGVEMTELQGTEIRSVRAVHADDRDEAVEGDGCRGTARARFSEDGRRIYTHVTQACDGDAAVASSGLIAMVSPTEWIDVQAEPEGESGLSWARRYRRASAERTRAAGFDDLVVDATVPARRARGAAASAVDVDDVLEAVRAVDPEAVRAWIAEMADPFELDARRLVRMADAGVPESVIDVMVAVSYPDRFALSHDGDIDRLAPAPPRAGRGPRRHPVPIYGGSYGYGSDYDAYLYDPYYYGYYGAPSVIVVAPRADPAPNAKAVKGRGYSRGDGSAPTGSSTSDSGKRGGESPPSSPPSTGPSKDSGSGSSRGGGRTAKPREN